MKFPAALVAGLEIFLLSSFFWLGLDCRVGAVDTGSAAQGMDGADLARRLGCFACHGVGRGHLAPSLEGIGSRLPREQLETVLLRPRKLYAGARMPSYAYLSTAERRALLDFLENLK